MKFQIYRELNDRRIAFSKLESPAKISQKTYWFCLNTAASSVVYPELYTDQLLLLLIKFYNFKLQ